MRNWDQHRGLSRWAGLLVAAASCAHPAGPQRNPAPTPDDAVVLNVTNNYGFPMELYAVALGTSRRIGTVHPGMSARYALPPGMSGNGMVEFVALAGRGVSPVRSGRLLVSPGSAIDFEIATHLLGSVATVRAPIGPGLPPPRPR